MTVSDTDLATADRLSIAALFLTRTLRILTRGGALTGAEAGALGVVIYGGRILARDLATHQDVTPATISRLVTELESKGLVTRTTDPDDARRQWIEATPKGAETLAYEHGRRMRPLAKVIAALSPEERTKVMAAIETLEGLTAKLQ